MPDQYGQPTFNDWMGITNQARAIGNDMDRRRTRQGIDTAAEYYIQNPEAIPGKPVTSAIPATLGKPAGPSEAGYSAAGNYANAMNTPQAPPSDYVKSRMGAVPISQQMVGKEAAIGMAQQIRMDEYGPEAKDMETYKVLKKGSKIVKKLGKAQAKNPDMDLEDLIKITGADQHGAASHYAIKRYAMAQTESEQGQQLLKQTLTAAATQEYTNIVAPGLVTAQAYRHQGDDENAYRAYKETSKKAHLTYELGEMDKKTGEIKLLYNKPGEDKAVDTGRTVTLDDLDKRFLSLLNKNVTKYAAGTVPAMRATMQRNVTSPVINGRDKGGKGVQISFLGNSITPTLKDQIMVTYDDGRPLTIFKTREDAERAGIEFPESAESQKSSLENDKTRAEINKLKAEIKDKDQSRTVEQLDTLLKLLKMDDRDLFGQGRDKSAGPAAAISGILALATAQAAEGAELTEEQKQSQKYALQFLSILDQLSNVDAGGAAADSGATDPDSGATDYDAIKAKILGTGGTTPEETTGHSNLLETSPPQAPAPKVQISGAIGSAFENNNPGYSEKQATAAKKFYGGLASLPIEGMKQLPISKTTVASMKDLANSPILKPLIEAYRQNQRPAKELYDERQIAIEKNASAGVNL